MNELNQKEILLKSSVPYAHPTEGTVDAKFVTIFPPSFRHINYIAPLKQKFTQALKSIQDQNTNVEIEDTDKDEDAEIDASTVIQILEASSIDMVEVIAIFKLLIQKSKLFKLDGETIITELLLDKIDIDDFYILLGEYIAAFIIASLQK